MIGYVIYINDLVMKKRIFSYVPMDNLYYSSGNTTRSLGMKKSYLGAFAISCTIGELSFSMIGELSFAKALCDIRSRIKLMPLAL